MPKLNLRKYKPHKMGDHSDDFTDTRLCECNKPTASQMLIEQNIYKKMLTEIDDLLQSDFYEELEVKSGFGGKITQKEARFMLETLGKIYNIAHCVRCDMCGRKYLIQNTGKITEAK